MVKLDRTDDLEIEGKGGKRSKMEGNGGKRRKKEEKIRKGA